MARTLSWLDSARCLHTNYAVFFPEDFPSYIAPLIALQAKAECGRCPVLQECRDTALRRGEPAGVWGALDADERRALLRPKKPPDP